MAKRQLRIVPDGDRGPHGPAIATADEIPEALASHPELQGLLERGVRAITALSGARGGAVRLLVPGQRTMKLAASVGMPAAWVARERSVADDCGMCGQALHGDGARLDSESLAGTPCATPFAGDARRGPAIAVALHCRGQAVGVFNLYFGDSSPVPADLAAILGPVADMLDLVLENALLEGERLRSSLVAGRQMLASEVHDSLAQGLAFMRMRMSLLSDAIKEGDRARALHYFTDVNGELGEAHGRLRELITQFRHGVDRGLAQALESTARTFEERTGVALRIENRAPDLRLPQEQEVQVYQIVQEALANVIKHAAARNVRVVIERGPRRVRVSVEDDGCGVQPTVPRARQSGHYGIDIMRERAQRIGGNLQIRSAPSHGTRVRIVMPVPADGGA